MTKNIFTYEELDNIKEMLNYLDRKKDYPNPTLMEKYYTKGWNDAIEHIEKRIQALLIK